MGFSANTSVSDLPACRPKSRYRGFPGVVSGLRYYSANLSRWLSRDPIGEQGGPHLYAFIMNRPVLLIDPIGLVGAASFVDPNSGKVVNPWLPMTANVQLPRQPDALDRFVASFSRSDADDLIISHFQTGKGDLHIPSSKINPTYHWLPKFDGGNEIIKYVCSCKTEQVVTNKATIETEFFFLYRVTFALNGKVRSDDGKYWVYTGTIKPQDEAFDFHFSKGRDWYAHMATLAGGIYQYIQGYPSFKIIFDGEVNHPHGGTCPTP